jgi:hypothetical protein
LPPGPDAAGNLISAIYFDGYWGEEPQSASVRFLRDGPAGRDVYYPSSSPDGSASMGFTLRRFIGPSAVLLGFERKTERATTLVQGKELALAWITLCSQSVHLDPGCARIGGSPQFALVTPDRVEFQPGLGSTQL